MDEGRFSPSRTIAARMRMAVNDESHRLSNGREANASAAGWGGKLMHVKVDRIPGVQSYNPWSGG